MSSLFITRDAHIMMLEVMVEKLFVPSSSPFDSVITSKYVVSFRFLDDEWIDIEPKRPDYKEYYGAVGQEHHFNGGKSVVFAMTESRLAEESEGLAIEIKAYRHISKYFEPADSNEIFLGCFGIGVDDLFNNIVEELRLRDELQGHLNIFHEHDPICMSTKNTFSLEGVPGTLLTLYVRLSYLGDCVIAEVDKPYEGPISYFYGQEYTNKDSPYEFCELKPPGKPRRDLPFPKPLDTCAVVCTCTDDQRNRKFATDDTNSTSSAGVKKRKKRRGKKRDDCGNGGKNRPTGIITVGIVDKPRPCEPIVEECIPVCCTTKICALKSAELPCLPLVTCLEPICCEN